MDNMNLPDHGTHCSDQTLNQLVALLEQDEAHGMSQLAQALDRWPTDARLYFLRGSCLAGQRRYEEALLDMQQAVQQAPGFAIARFQWGFLRLTCGDAQGAQQAWVPLDQLAPGDPLRLFKQGLCCLALDQFAQTVEFLSQGIAANQANPHLNKDMQLVIDQVHALVAKAQADQQDASAVVDQSGGDTHLLLSEYAGNRGGIH
jgi:tetratricopeptide (TPR) repeat protein